MLHLLLASFFSLLIVIAFKLFDRYDIDANQAIVVNYITCVITGCLTLGEIPFEAEMINAPWAPIILFLGFWFIMGFNIASLTVTYFGMALATVAQRMSLGISATFSILYFHDDYNTYKILGILMALVAVIFINIPNKEEKINNNQKNRPRWIFIFPFLACLISAVVEIALLYLHTKHNMKPSTEAIVLFGSAAMAGILILGIQVLLFREKLKFRNLIAGILLGVPNYYSIYFTLLALGILDGSTVYSISNILIVGSSALVGFLVFKERLSQVNTIGIGMAILSIVLLIL